jgi:RNA polymerase sigma-70 factor (ECF subfamily)
MILFDHMERSDNQIITDYLGGDKKSLEILIKRYLKPIFSFVCRYVGNSQEAEDITQEVFVKTWRNLKKFKPEYKYAPNRTCSGSGFKTWIFSIAKNTSINFLKKKKAIPFSEFENERGENTLIETLADPALLVSKLLEQADITRMLTSVMEKLSPNYRMVLFLRYNDHFTFREIAEVLREPLNTVKSRHRRALIMLRKLLSDS